MAALPRGRLAASPDAGTEGAAPCHGVIWEGWFRAWGAGHWTPDDLPQLRVVIHLVDRVLRGDVKRLAEVRQWLDAFGITPKGQQDRRWQRPEPPRPSRPWRGALAEARIATSA